MAFNFYSSTVAYFSFLVLQLLLCVHQIQDSFLKERFHEVPHTIAQVFAVVRDFRLKSVRLTCVKLKFLFLWMGSSFFVKDWNSCRIQFPPL